MTKKFSTLFERIQALQAKAIEKSIASSVNFQISSFKKALVSYYFIIDDKYLNGQICDNKYIHLDVQQFDQIEQIVIDHMNKL